MVRRLSSSSGAERDGPASAARRLAELASTAGSAAELFDAMAAEILGLPGVNEVHVQRLDASSEPGLVVAYAPGPPLRRRIYVTDGLGDAAQRALAASAPVAARRAVMPREAAVAAGEDVPVLVMRVGPPAAPCALLTLVWDASLADGPGVTEQAETLAAVTTAALGALAGRVEAGVDPHTGCLNESAMAARLDEEIGRAHRHGTSLSCLLLALDDLDAIGLRYGAAMSEHTLGHVGAVLRREFRRFDRVAYLGRGEFAIVLAGASGTQAEAVARRLLARIHAIKLEERGTRRSLRGSVGLGEWQRSQGAWELIGSARAAMLRAGSRERDAEAPEAAAPAPSPTPYQ